MRAKPEHLGIPIKSFLFTLDQIATLIDVEESDLRRIHVHFQGKSVGVRPIEKMLAIDLNRGAAGEPPNWRISDSEFIRWLKYKGFRVYERAWITR